MVIASNGTQIHVKQRGNGELALVFLHYTVARREHGTRSQTNWLTGTGSLPPITAAGATPRRPPTTTASLISPPTPKALSKH